MNAKKILLIVLAVIGIAILGIGIGGTTYIYKEVKAFDKVFALGVSVDGLSISGLTRDEAYDMLQKHIEDDLKSKKLILAYGDVSVEIPYLELGIMYNIDEVLDEAYQVGHSGNVFQRYQYATNPYPEEKSFTLSCGYNHENIHKIIENNANKFYKEAVNATIKRVNRQFVITDEVDGQELDQVATLENITTFLENNQSGKVEAAIKVVEPAYTAESFKDIQNLVASFYTTYNNADPNRNVNLKVGSEKINTTVLPGEIFALSKFIEPITYEGGYRASKVIVNGMLEEGIGGGICQVASTLYNALLMTDLEITMRQNHSLSVAYVPLGRDATYSTNSIDFQFKNNSQYPIFIESYCENNKLYVNLYGHIDLKPKYTIKFDSVTTETIHPPATKYVEDPTLPEGQKIEEVTALYGKKVKLYKLYYDGNALVKKELVNDSYYRPRASVVKVGTKKSDVPVINQDADPSGNNTEPSRSNTDSDTEIPTSWPVDEIDPFSDLIFE